MTYIEHGEIECKLYKNIVLLKNTNARNYKLNSIFFNSIGIKISKYFSIIDVIFHLFSTGVEYFFFAISHNQLL